MDLPAGFEQYPDFLAMGLLLLGTLFISIGVKVTHVLLTCFWYKFTKSVNFSINHLFQLIKRLRRIYC